MKLKQNSDKRDLSGCGTEALPAKIGKPCFALGEPETNGRTGIDPDPCTISPGTQHCAETNWMLETVTYGRLMSGHPQIISGVLGRRRRESDRIP